MDYDNLPHFLQSPAWRTFHEALGHKVVTASGPGWSYLAILEQNHGIKRLYCPYGPSVKSVAALTEALNSLQTTARSLGVAYLRIQPLGITLDESLTSDLRLSPIAYSQPQETWVIDLNQSEDDLLAGMKQNTRNVVRNYQKKGLRYRSSQDPDEIDKLLTLLHQVAAHNDITLHSDEYLARQATSLLPIGAARLHFIDYQSITIAAALTYQDDSTVYYAHAAADHQHRKLNASTALVGEIILQAKADGKTTFDLFGITTSTDPSHRWHGFTRFKQSFGGQLRTLSQTYESPVKPLLYGVYNLLRKFRRG